MMVLTEKNSIILGICKEEFGSNLLKISQKIVNIQQKNPTEKLGRCVSCTGFGLVRKVNKGTKNPDYSHKATIGI